MQYLVITNDSYKIDWSEKQDILANEALIVWKNLLNGNLRNIWLTENTNDAILLFESENEDNVKRIMESLPIVQEHLISYKIIGLTPYKGLERLFSENRK